MSSETLKRNLPRFELEEVRSAARELYGIRGEFSSQSSERDLSWKVRIDNGDTVVLKIANAAEPEAIVDFQVRALEHIAARNERLPVPRMVSSGNGRPYEWIESRGGERHILRVLSYLPGDAIETRADALCGRMRFALGALVAELDLALRGFFHPAARSNDHLWDLTRCLELRAQVELLADAELRALCHRVLDHAETSVLEGAELEVLQGGKTVIDKNRPLIYFESGAPNDEQRLIDIWHELNDLNYRVLPPNRLAHNDAEGLSLVGFLESHLYPRRCNNFFAVPAEKRIEIRDRARKILGVGLE